MSNDLNAKQGRSTQSNRDFHRPKNPKIVTNQPNNWDQVDWNTQKTPDTASKWDQERTPETYEYQGPTRPYSSGNPTQPPAFTGAITPNTARRQVHNAALQAAIGFEDDDIWVPSQSAPRTPAPHGPYAPPTDPQGSQSQYPYQNQYQGTPDPSGSWSRVPGIMPLNRSARQRVPAAMRALEVVITPTIGTADTGVVRDADLQPQRGEQSSLTPLLITRQINQLSSVCCLWILFEFHAFPRLHTMFPQCTRALSTAKQGEERCS